MSFFRPKFPEKEPKESIHPWNKTIKDVYSKTYKYGHNSANNPVYPLKKEIVDKNRIKFTVIGNRITKEFIFCYYLVKLLHKYKRKRFEAPVIQGVTSVEWPKVWNDLKIKYGSFAYCIDSQVVVLMDDKFLGGQKELKEYVGSKYIYHLCIDYYTEGIQQFANYIRSTGRPFVYMQFTIDDKEIGTMIFMLYSDIAPLTCQNFLRLCETTKGGYTGTPVHRIVKDGWIQCGGYSLKDNPSLECENFITQHDRRGVLCMANNGRHVDCSTQFFVLLQPAPWMAHKYVAFGQLIEGEATLSKIENVPTWYESPTADIRIYKSGIFNMDCHWVPINKHTHEYIHRHVENLFEIGEIFYDELMQKVFLEVEFRRIQRLESEGEAEYEEETAELETEGEGIKDVHATKRFIRKKSEIEKTGQEHKKRLLDEALSVVSMESKDYVEDEYKYEYEDYACPPEAVPSQITIKPDIPYNLALTDVPYPGEVASDFNLQKMLRGDYCYESDIVEDPAKRRQQPDQKRKISIPETLLCALFDCFEDEDVSDASLDTDEENDIKNYLKDNGDSTSFAGRVIKKIANLPQKYALFDDTKKKPLEKACLTDDELRIRRMAEKEIQSSRVKKVSISLTASKLSHTKIQRRPTGYIRLADLASIHNIHGDSDESIEEESDLDDSDTRKVRIKTSTSETRRSAMRADVPRQSVLARLYVDVKLDDYDERPTLKDFKPSSEMKSFIFITKSDTHLLLDDSRERMLDRQPIGSQTAIDHILDMQHGKKFSRKISNDYTRTIKQIEEKPVISLKSFEFAKKRPSMSVVQYKQKNLKYHEELMASSRHMSSVGQPPWSGLRLPGDSPLYIDSMETTQIKSHAGKIPW